MGVDLVDITAKRAALTPQRIALADGSRALSYAQLDSRAARCAGALAGLGIGRGDRVAVLCRNRIEFFEIMFACAKLGAILAPLNWRAPAAELAPLLADCEPRLLIYGAEDAALAGELAHAKAGRLALDGGGEGRDYEAALAEAAPHAGERLWRGDAIWSLLYTSGTTGQPKAVIQTYQMAAVNTFHVMQAFGLRERDRTLNFLPLFHTAGIQLVTLPALIAGGSVRVMPGFDAGAVLPALSELDVFFAVPAVYRALSLHPDFDAADLSGVRAWGCGGAPLPDELVERFAAKGALVCNGYGMTETGPTAFVATPEDALAKIGSVGKPQMLLDVRIVGEDGADVEEGACGEIWMRGAGLTPGYWRRPQETEAAFAGGGWFRSGDIGRRDADGCYYVAGRIKEMYISGGENVYPAEVERALERHPAVLEAAVIGVADARWGEVGHAFVLLRPQAPAAPSAEELLRFCRSQLAAFKAPQRLDFVDEFPRTPAGKIRKHLLAAGAPA